MELNFRLLKAEEISVRTAQVNKGGLQLLLYKDARADQQILDETLGITGWQKRYTRDNKNCVISIWDDEKLQWIQKEDTGTESNMEADKGLASDAQKRAATAFSIGRELYSSPDIFITANNLATFSCVGGKYKCYDKFIVTEIVYNANKTINSVTLMNLNNGYVQKFSSINIPQRTIILEDKPEAQKQTPVVEETAEQMQSPQDDSLEQHNKRKIGKAQKDNLIAQCERYFINLPELLNFYKVNNIDDITFRMYDNMMANWSKIIDKFNDFF